MEIIIEPNEFTAESKICLLEYNNNRHYGFIFKRNGIQMKFPRSNGLLWVHVNIYFFPSTKYNWKLSYFL